MRKALKAIELKVLDILEKIGAYRINLQVHKFLMFFRKFQDQNVSSHIANMQQLEIDVVFQNLFKFHQLDTEIKLTDILIQ